MDDEEYYSKLRRQYTNPLERKKKNGSGKYSSWAVPHGREDAEMLEEREMTDSKTDEQFSGEIQASRIRSTLILLSEVRAPRY